MTAATASPAMLQFVDYFGALGPRWGLPAEACRVHAYLYLVARPVRDREIAAALALDDARLREALDFLVDYRMVEGAAPAGWRVGDEPWDMLAAGLEERRRRELPPALATLRDCHGEALKDGRTDRRAARQIGRMLDLVEGLAALDAGARRLSPRFLRRAAGVSGRAARAFHRTFRSRTGEE